MKMIEDKDQKAKQYAKINYLFVLINFFYTFLILVVFLFSGASTELAAAVGRLAGSGWLGQALYILFFMLFFTVVSAPLGFYRSYFIEHRFGLSNQTIDGWFSDEAKSLVLSIIIFTPLGLAAYKLLVLAQAYWWLYATALFTVFNFILAFLAPVLIMPLFNKFGPIGSESLKSDILNLAKKAGVSITDVLRTDMSKRTKKANAYFTGMGRTKRIVLGDTLLDEYTDPEILTVVGHEMGHWKLGHLIKGAVVGIVGALIGFYLANLFLWLGIVYFGFNGLGDIAGLPLIILAFLLLGFFSQPASNALSRYFEYQADMFELELVGLPDATISTFKKLAEQNLADPAPSPIIEFLLYSHLSIARRILMVEEYKKRLNVEI